MYSPVSARTASGVPKGTAFRTSSRSPSMWMTEASTSGFRSSSDRRRISIHAPRESFDPPSFSSAGSIMNAIPTRMTTSRIAMTFEFMEIPLHRAILLLAIIYFGHVVTVAVRDILFYGPVDTSTCPLDGPFPTALPPSNDARNGTPRTSAASSMSWGRTSTDPAGPSPP